MGDVFNFNFDPGPLVGIILLLAIAGFGFIIWMLIDAISRPVEHFSRPNAKTGWIVGLALGLVLGFGFLGVIVTQNP